jgi:hypothetical protein
VRDAFMTAAQVMPDKPPARFANGRAFRSRWRLRATWKLIPPTALLSGSSWDLTPKGVELDVPFQIKLSTRVMLLKVDNRDHSIAEAR